MKKKQLVQFLSRAADIPQRAAGRALKAIAWIIPHQLVRPGDRLALPGVGVFSLVKRRSKVAISLYTGDPFGIPAGLKIRFTPARALRRHVKGS